jgi:hypothetical protein
MGRAVVAVKGPASSPVVADRRRMDLAEPAIRDHQERLFPVRPHPAREHPEEFVNKAESRFGVPALQYSKLLTKRQILNEQRSAGAKAAGK